MHQAINLSPSETRTLSRPTMPAVLLRLEGLAVFAGSIALYAHISGDWLPFVLLLFAPDAAMLGYLLNPRIGAALYNAAHFYGLPLALGLAALAGGWLPGVALALIWTAHIGMDRAIGYGLKYASGFKDTHLGRV